MSIIKRTGATGFIGSAIIKELLAAGHQVIGLTRSDEGSKSLTAIVADVQRGSLDDPGNLRAGAEKSDSVIHCAYHNNFSAMETASKLESQSIEALGSILVGSDRPLLITSVATTGIAATGQLATENHFDPNQPNPRKTTEIAGAAMADRGVNVSIIRLPQVHNIVKQGIITGLIRLARE